MTTVRAFGSNLSGLNIPLAAALLCRIGMPWRLVSGGNVRSFSPRTAPQMADHIKGRQTSGAAVFFLPPVFDGAHHFLVARISLTACPAELSPPPQFTICSDDYTCIWRIVEPVGEALAKRMATKLVTKAKGRPAIGEPIPLPGTMLIREVGVRMAQRFPVSLLPPLAVPAYHFVGDRLVVNAEPELVDDGFTRADQLDLTATAWLWPGIIPAGEFVILVGPPKAGKSTIAVDIAARITRGGAWPDDAPGSDPSGVILIETEDPINVTQARLAAAGANMKRVALSASPRDLSVPAALGALDRQARKLHGIKALIISPVRMFFGDVEAHGQIDMRQRLVPLLDWAKANAITVLGIAHREAGKLGRQAEEVAGPKAIIQRARAVLSAMVDPNDRLAKINPLAARRILTSAGSNLGADTLELPYRIVSAPAGDGVESSKVEWMPRALD